MAEVLIETKAAVDVSTPTVGYVEFFYDSSNGGRLSYKSSDGLVHVLGATSDNDCACDIQKEFWCNVAGMVKRGFMSAAQFQTLVNTGFNVTESNVIDNLGNTTTVINSGAVVYPVVSVSITADPGTLDLSSSPTFQLTTAILPSSSNQSILWVSSDITKVTVSSTGLLTGIGIGSATIYAYSASNPTKFDTVVVPVQA